MKLLGKGKGEEKVKNKHADHNIFCFPRHILLAIIIAITLRSRKEVLTAFLRKTKIMCCLEIDSSCETALPARISSFFFLLRDSS
jgi:hypothetical protein